MTPANRPAATSGSTPPPVCPYSLPKPAEVVTHDFRPNNAAPTYATGRPLKMVQWNIERGYQLEAVIEELRALDADVLALQEIDVYCERSAFQDTGRRIAEALQLSYAFVCEFEELHDPVREASSQGGGVHGNAILSKFDISAVRAVEHTQHPIDWEAPTHKLAMREPRRGRRLTTAAVVHTHQGRLLVYSAHLECFCGMLARMWQTSDIFRDTREQFAAGAADAAALLGDLNTLANGVARLSSNYCTDHMRWWSLGYSEAQMWDRHLLSVQDPITSNAWLKRQGLPDLVCKDAVNPGYADPFDARLDITLDHPKYRYFGMHLMTGKLDWLLLRNCRVVGTSIGNHDYSRSDHKWLGAEVHIGASAL